MLKLTVSSVKNLPVFRVQCAVDPDEAFLRSLVKVYRAVERYWRRMLCSRSWAGRRLTWDAFNQIKERTPLLKPKLRLPYGKL